MLSKSLTSTKEDYLRALYILQNRSGSPVGITQIAKYLNLSKSTVSERLKNLAEQGLISKNAYTAVGFTPKGQDIAKQLTFKHRIIEVFLHNALKVPKDKIHREANLLEHAFSDEIINKLDKYLNKPKFDPHGELIPRGNKKF